MAKKKPKLSSGDWLVDWFFQKFITILNHPEFEVIGVPHLYMERGRKRKIEVFAYVEGLCLYYNLSPKFHPSRDKLGVTLCHELLHVLLKQDLLSHKMTIELYDMESTTHRDVYFLERIWHRFSLTQRDMLLSYLSAPTT